MDSFEELGLSPDLVEALAAEGLERPTDLQESAIPVLARGNNLVAVAGPGAGVVVAVFGPLLGRVEPGPEPRILALTPTRARAAALADSIGRLARATGHRAAAAMGPWALPERSSVLVATPAEARAWLREGRLSLSAVAALVVDGAAAIQAAGDLDEVEPILEALQAEAQRVLVALPLTPELQDLADRHLRKAVHLPPRAVDEDGTTAAPARGRVRVREVGDAREEDALALCAELLASGDVRHVVLFVRSDDAAADVGDALMLRGFHAGAPGDEDVPVWLAVDDLEARAGMDAAGEGVVPVSVDVPHGPDALDRRHGAGRGGVILAESRELPHLRDIARRTGYTLEPFPAPPSSPGPGGLSALLSGLQRALEGDDVGLEAYQLVLEPLVSRHGGARVAAAALGLVRAKGVPAAAAGAAAGAPARTAATLPATVKLFVSLGQRDGIGPGDLVGAIAGEAGIPGSRIGRIDLRESFSIVEVDHEVAEKVIRALNGTTVKGRSVRVDLDRSERERGSGGRGPAGAGGNRPSGPGSRRPPGRGRPGSSPRS